MAACDSKVVPKAACDPNEFFIVAFFRVSVFKEASKNICLFSL
jgi:hypothetical protein